MKKIFLGLILSLITVSLLKAQEVYPNYQDGVIYFKIDYSQGIKFTVNEDLSVNVKEFPSLTAIFKKYGVTSLSRPFYLFGNIDLLNTIRAEFTEINQVENLIADLNAEDIIEFAEKVPLAKVKWNPNDPYYGTVNGGNFKWHLDLIKADSAWDVQRGNPNIKVAIVDNFVWGDHPDLQISSSNLCKFTSSTKYTTGSASPSSSTIPQGSTSSAYSASHGTHCAGLVGAINNNGTGIASIGGGVTLMGVATGTESYPEYIRYGNEGIQWAANNGANVISMSYGTSASSTTEQTIMQACYNAGIVLVAAAGNEGDDDNAISYPGGYSTVISVASVNGDGKLSDFSQWGTGRADIAAPGGYISTGTYYPNILSTTYCKSYLLKYYYSSFSNTYYDGMQGTSMACPIVAGLCGLLLSKDSNMTPAQILIRLQETATPLNSASEHTIDGYGYINAYEALGYNFVCVSDTSLLYSSEANQSRIISIESNVSWNITNIPSWLTVNPLSGSAGTTYVTITTKNVNNGSTINSSVLTIQSDSTSPKYLTVNQSNHVLSVAVSPKYTILPSTKGTSDTLYINANLNWEIINESTWLGLNKTSGSGNDTIIFSTKSANTWSTNRSCMLIIKALNYKNDTAIVEQRLPDFIKVSTTSDTLSNLSGSNVSVTVLSNISWTVSGNQNWVSVNVSNGYDTADLVFTALSNNTSGTTRSSTFTVSNGSITRNITIVQKGNVSISEIDNENNWTLYPNPTFNVLTINTKNINPESVEIVDIVGKIITKCTPNEEIKLDVSSYANGIYFVRVTSKTNQITCKKFIKQ